MTAAQGSGDGGGGMSAAESQDAQPADEAAPPAPEPGGTPPSHRQSSKAAGAVRRVIEFESTSVLIALIALVAFISWRHSDFFQWQQLKDVLQQSVYVAILAGGMSFLIAMREIDLSVGSMFGLTLILAALLMSHGMNPWVAVLLGILSGGAMGLLNAILVQAIAIPAIVATLATLSMYRGLALAISDGQQVVNVPTGHKFFTFFGGDALGVPVSVWVMVIVAIVLTAILRLTPYGYRVRSIGSNPEAATFSGISIPRVRVQTLVLMGILAGIAGMLGLAFFTSGDPEHRHRVRAPGDRCGDHRRYAATRR